MSARATRAGLLACCALLLGSASAWGGCPSVVGGSCKYGDDDDQGWIGSWSSQFPPLVATLTLRSISYVPSARNSFDGNVESSSLAYQFNGSAFGAPLRTFGVETGLLWYPTPFTYLGPAVGVGAGKYASSGFVANALTITPRDSLNVTTTIVGGIVGLRLPLGLLSVRGELFTGADFLSIDQYAANGANLLTATSSATAFLLEPRATLDLWATPFLTVSLFGAMPDFEPRAADGGIVIAGHLRAFDGRYGIF